MRLAVLAVAGLSVGIAAGVLAERDAGVITGSIEAGRIAAVVPSPVVALPVGGTIFNAQANAEAPVASDAPVAKADPVALAPRGPISAIWANEGGDKVAREELRASTAAGRVINRVWDGQRVALFGARNEVLGFNLVLEAADQGATEVEVSFDGLTGPGGYRIASRRASGPDGVFDWTGRPIELFLVRYLQIRGLSALSYETYDERHVPARFRRPIHQDGSITGGWKDRPDAGKHYPEIAVPMELHPRFAIDEGTSQSVWVDIYLPKDAPPGDYSGEIVVKAAGAELRRVPVLLKLRGFTLPDMPAAKTMVATSYDDVVERYAGVEVAEPLSHADQLAQKVLRRQLMLAHRHKISLVDDNAGAGTWAKDAPRPVWVPALTGEMFTAGNGYDGPGVGVGTNVYSIGTYGKWRDWWGEPNRETMWRHADGWENWFRRNAPDTERFLYLIDESDDLPQTERWAAWMDENPGPGKALPSFATVDLLEAIEATPSVDIIASWFAVADTQPWQAAADRIEASPDRKLYLYNGMRPASGSFAIEDDGVALRQLPWAQWKKGVDRWFYWQSTYYDDFQGDRGPTDVFEVAQTFGGPTEPDAERGLSGWNASNGDGVLFYPGTDKVYPDKSYDLAGPIASIRMKLWRRGIQDVDYIAMAAKVDEAATRAIVERMVPKVLWETGVDDPNDPTWALVPISWSIDPDDWEAARAELADIIERGG